MRLRSKPKAPCKARPMSPPTSPIDSLAQRLVAAIRCGPGIQRDISIRVPWIHLIPSRLESSQALRDAVQLFLNSWTTARCHPTEGSSLHRISYGIALKSLRTALQHPQEAFTSTTLAATSLLYTSEYNFELKRQANRNNHTSGLQGLIVERGPPRIDDELDVCLSFDAVGALLVPTISSRTQNFFESFEWLKVMTTAHESGVIKDKSLRLQGELCLLTARWPTLARDLRDIHIDQNRESVLDLVAKAGQVAEALASFDQIWILPMLENQDSVWMVPDDSMPRGSSFSFASWDSCSLITTHAMTTIAVNQILYSALLSAHVPAEHLRGRLYELS